MTGHKGLIWGDLLHLGMNMWCDWENPTPLSYGWEETVIRWPVRRPRTRCGCVPRRGKETR